MMNCSVGFIFIYVGFFRAHVLNLPKENRLETVTQKMNMDTLKVSLCLVIALESSCRFS